MSTPRQPSRLAVYSVDGVFYPRELAELDGKLYLYNEDGSFTILNKSEVTSIEDATGASIGSVDPSKAGTITIPNASTSKRGLVVFSTATPKGAGTAAVGSSDAVARADHIHPLQTTVSGNAGTATKLAAGVNIGLSGVSATAQSFDGSKAITIPITAVPASIVTGLATVATSGKYSDLTGTPVIPVATDEEVPLAPGTAAVGESEDFARADHVHPVQTSVSGNAGTATKLAAGVNIGLSGVTATAQSFDGSKAITIPITAVPASIVTGLAAVATSGSYNDLSNKPSIPAASSTTPKAAGTAAVGTGTTWARADHVHPVQTTVSGNAGTATKLASAVSIGLSGVTATAQDFDGSDDIVIPITAVPASIVTGLATVATSGSYNDLSNKPTIYGPSSTTPKAAGTATVGTGTTFARADHIHPAQTSVSGNAGTATKLAAGVNIGLSGAVTATAQSFDGSAGITIPVTAIDGSKITGTIPLSAIPKGAQERMIPVADDTARLALTSSNAQNGDVVKVEDTGIMYYIVDDTKLGTEEAFSVFTAGAASSVAWTGITGKPTFATVATSGSYNDLSNKPTIYTASSTTPKVAGTAAVGSETKFARGDHVHPAQTSVSGNAGTATKLATAVSIGLSGVTATAQDFDGSDDIVIPITAVPASIVTGLATVATSGKYSDLTGTPSIPAASSTTPKAAGTAAVGTGTTWARADHVHPKQTTVSGNAGTATKLAAAVNIGLSGVTATAQEFDGSADITIPITAVPASIVTGLATVATSGSYSDLSNKPTIYGPSSTTPKAAGTAAVGTGTTFARADHVHPLQTTVSGNAGTATKFATAQSVALTGDVTGSASSQAGWSITTTLADSGVEADSYGTAEAATLAHGGSFNVPYITVDAKGRITTASSIALKLPAAPTSVSGNAGTATKFASAQSVALTGDVTGSASSQAGWSIAATLANSGVTAGSYGPSANATPAFGATFNVPYITVDAKGRVTAASTKTVKIPAHSHPAITIDDDTTSTVSPGYAGTFTAIDSVERDGNGHVTTINTKTVTMPSAQTTVSGNAGTATKLATARKLTIGSTGKDFDGSAALSWTLAEIGAAAASHGTHVSFDSTNKPKAAGTAAFGTATTVSRSDHVHPAQTTVSGNAGSATKLATARTLTIGSTGKDFDGSAALSWTLAEIGAAAASHGTHVSFTTTAPKAAGTAAVGTATTVSRSDHVHPAQTTVSGNAGTATKFASAQSVALTGDVTGSASSQAGWSIATTLANSGVTAGSYGPSANTTPAHAGGTFKVPYITVDAKGRVTAASSKTITMPDGANTYTASITTTWTGSAAPYTQTITVSGIKATDNPIVDVVPSSTYATAQTQLTEYAKIYKITTAANSITVYATEKTTTAVPIQLKCVYD